MSLLEPRKERCEQWCGVWTRNPDVLTQGTSGKDFQSTSGTTCTATTYSNGSSCILNLMFSPTAPGVRSFAVVFYDTASPPNVMATVPLSGTGVESSIVLRPGVITIMAGTGVNGFSGDNGSALSAEVSSPTGVATDSAGNLYIADYQNGRVRKVNASTGVIITFAGGGSGCAGQSDSIGDGCAASDATLSSPSDVAIDFPGNVYIADLSGNLIRRVDAATNVITTVAGGDTGCAAQMDTVGDGCPATSAALSVPEGIALDGSGNLYISDSGNSRVRKVDAITGFISNIAGVGLQGFSGDGGPATNAALSGPNGVAVDGVGNVYVADYLNVRVRKIDAVTGFITTVAGNGIIGNSGDNGLATQAQLSGPWGLAVDAAGDLYISDYPSYVVRSVDAATGVIRTIAGGGGGCAAQTDLLGDNCAATLATFGGSYGLSVDGAGNLYLADGNDGRIRTISNTSAPLDFPQTNAGSSSVAQTITVSNIANASLTFSGLGASQNFGIDAATTTCTTSSSLASGDSCQIGVIFAPTAGGSLSGNLTLTDNSLNVNGNTQSVQLSGIGSSTAATTTIVSAPPITYGASANVTVTVTSGQGTVTGNVALTVDNASPLTQSLSGGSTVFTISGLPAGSHSLSASYTAQGSFGASSVTGTQTVNQASSGIVLMSSGSPTIWGQNVNLTAAITPQTAGWRPALSPSTMAPPRLRPSTFQGTPRVSRPQP